MSSLLLRKVAILFVFFASAVIYSSCVLAIPLLLGSMPTLSLVVSSAIFSISVVAMSFVPALFFQETLKKQSKIVVALLFFLYVVQIPKEWPESYGIRLGLFWYLVFILFTLKTSCFKVSWRYWVFFTGVSAFSASPLMQFAWNSDFSRNQGYEYFVMDNISYHVFSPWADSIKAAHASLPDDIKKTNALIVGLASADVMRLSDSIRAREGMQHYGGATVPNPFRPLFYISLKDYSEESAARYEKWNTIQHYITHEMTHVQQFQKYGIRAMFFPNWKIEGHATYRSQDFGNASLYFALKSLTKNATPFRKTDMQILLDADFAARIENYDFFQLQGWYYLGYLGMDLNTFFSSSVGLADWGVVKEAWFEVHKDWVAENQQNLDLIDS